MLSESLEYLESSQYNNSIAVYKKVQYYVSADRQWRHYDFWLSITKTGICYHCCEHTKYTTDE